MLKRDGLLYIADIVFEEKNVQEKIKQWIAKFEIVGGPEIRADIEMHIGREFSTYDWIMDGLLERAGFRIESKAMEEGVIGRYLCRKESECA